jgi:undecaprenyl-diphosphatase
MYATDLSIFNTLFGLSGHSQWSDWVIVFFAEYLPYLIVLIVVYAIYKIWREGKGQKIIGYFLAFVSAGIGRGIVSIIRHYYPHPRPPAALHITPLFPETTSSFPSGHAVFFFALAAGVYMVDKKLGRLLYILATLVGIARIVAGVHWPSDIVAGALLGILTSYTVFKIWEAKGRPVWKNI